MRSMSAAVRREAKLRSNLESAFRRAQGEAEAAKGEAGAVYTSGFVAGLQCALDLLGKVDSRSQVPDPSGAFEESWRRVGRGGV